MKYIEIYSECMKWMENKSNDAASHYKYQAVFSQNFSLRRRELGCG